MRSVSLKFINRDAAEDHDISVSYGAIDLIVRWYSGFHAGDDFDVFVAGRKVELDSNGFMQREVSHAS